MEQTAVEWLYNEIKHIIPDDFLEKFKRAKEMENEQEERAYKRGQKHKKPLKDSNPINKYLKSE